MGDDFDPTFYATAAQIIPVLLLALVFERRYFDRDYESVAVRVYLFSTLTFLFGAEFLAVTTIMEPATEPDGIVDVTIGAGIVSGFLALGVPLFRAQTTALGRTLKPRAARVARLLPLLFVVAIVASLMVFQRAGTVFAVAILVLGGLAHVVPFEWWDRLTVSEHQRDSDSDDESENSDT